MVPNIVESHGHEGLSPIHPPSCAYVKLQTRVTYESQTNQPTVDSGFAYGPVSKNYLKTLSKWFQLHLLTGPFLLSSGDVSFLPPLKSLVFLEAF